MKTYRIETATTEFSIPEEMLDRIINSFWADGYQVLNDDTGEMAFSDETGESPTMVYREETSA